MNFSETYSTRASHLAQEFQRMAASPDFPDYARRQAVNCLGYLEGILRQVQTAAVDMNEAPSYAVKAYREVAIPLLEGQIAFLETALAGLQMTGVHA